MAFLDRRMIASAVKDVLQGKGEALNEVGKAVDELTNVVRYSYYWQEQGITKYKVNADGSKGQTEIISLEDLYKAKAECENFFPALHVGTGNNLETVTVGVDKDGAQHLFTAGAQTCMDTGIQIRPFLEPGSGWTSPEAREIFLERMENQISRQFDRAQAATSGRFSSRAPARSFYGR